MLSYILEKWARITWNADSRQRSIDLSSRREVNLVTAGGRGYSHSVTWCVCVFSVPRRHTSRTGIFGGSRSNEKRTIVKEEEKEFQLSGMRTLVPRDTSWITPNNLPSVCIMHTYIPLLRRTNLLRRLDVWRLAQVYVALVRFYRNKF